MEFSHVCVEGNPNVLFTLIFNRSEWCKAMGEKCQQTWSIPKINK